MTTVFARNATDKVGTTKSNDTETFKNANVTDAPRTVEEGEERKRQAEANVVAAVANAKTANQGIVDAAEKVEKLDEQIEALKDGDKEVEKNREEAKRDAEKAVAKAEKDAKADEKANEPVTETEKPKSVKGTTVTADDTQGKDGN